MGHFGHHSWPTPSPKGGGGRPELSDLGGGFWGEKNQTLHKTKTATGRVVPKKLVKNFEMEKGHNVIWHYPAFKRINPIYALITEMIPEKLDQNDITRRPVSMFLTFLSQPMMVVSAPIQKQNSKYQSEKFTKYYIYSQITEI